MIIARQSTARTVTIGPVLDADGAAVTDGVVADLKLSKNGGAPAALNGSATLTHRHTGHYSLALTASDLDTVGQAEIVIDDTTNACPMKEITVLEEAVYDALFAASATGLLPANVTQVDGSTAGVAGFKRALRTIVTGTADAGCTTTEIVAKSLSFGGVDPDQLKGLILKFPDDTATAALRGQGTDITGFDEATQTFTVTALSTAPAEDDVFVIQ